MCAIFGIGVMKGSTVKDGAALKSVTRRLFAESEIRGNHAAGIAYANRDTVKVLKHPTNAKNLINLPEYLALEEECVQFGEAPLFSITAHCRYKTKGEPSNNLNNHPIITKDLVGVHNGHINNDDAMFGMYKNHINRRGEVDSEIIFALIEHFHNCSSFAGVKEEKGIASAISNASMMLDGTMACGMVHVKNPHIIWAFRKTGPMNMVIFEEVGVIIYSSSIDYIKNAVEGHDFGLAVPVEIGFNSGVGIDLINGRIQKFIL